jgi:hypothetical protein
MTWLMTDIRHVCKLAGISFDEVLERSREKFESEQTEFGEGDSA